MYPYNQISKTQGTDSCSDTTHKKKVWLQKGIVNTIQLTTITRLGHW